jgi:amino acid transporter
VQCFIWWGVGAAGELGGGEKRNFTMKEDINNKQMQVWVFIICLIVILVGIVMLMTGNNNFLFSWFGFWNGQWSSKSQPFFIPLFFAFIGIWYSGRNLLRMRSKKNEK